MEVKLPFLETDFNKQGKLKKVRGRVLKKLMKYDLRAIFSALLPCLATLFISAIIIGLTSLGMSELGKGLWLVLWSLLFYVLTFLVLYFATRIPFKRFHSNFFQDEGYLTLTIPASAEEHLLSKHLSGSISLLAALAGIILASTLMFVCSGLTEFLFLEELMKALWQTFLKTPVRFIEETILLIEFIIAIFTVGGAIICLMRKIPNKRHSGIVVLAAFVLAYLFTNLLRIPEILEVFLFFSTPVDIHILALLRFLFMGGLIVLSVWFELRTLKTNINLK